MNEKPCMRDQHTRMTKFVYLFAALLTVVILGVFLFGLPAEVRADDVFVAVPRKSEFDASQQLACPVLIDSKIVNMHESWGIQLDYDLETRRALDSISFDFFTQGQRYDSSYYTYTLGFVPQTNLLTSYLFDVENHFVTAEIEDRAESGDRWNRLADALRSIDFRTDASPTDSSRVFCNCQCPGHRDVLQPITSQGDKFVSSLNCISKDEQSSYGDKQNNMFEIMQEDEYDTRIVIRGDRKDLAALNSATADQIEDWNEEIANKYRIPKSSAQQKYKSFNRTLLILITEEKPNIDIRQLETSLTSKFGETTQVLLWPFTDATARSNTDDKIREMTKETPRLRLNLGLGRAMEADLFVNSTLVWKFDGQPCQTSDGETQSSLGAIFDPFSKPRNISPLSIWSQMLVYFLIATFFIILYLWLSILAYQRDWRGIRGILDEHWKFPWSSDQ